MAITSEFRHGTIRPTFVVTPHRTRVIAAKVIASLLMGVLFGLAAIGLSFGVGYAILAVRDIPLELETSHVALARARHAGADRGLGRDRRRPRRGGPQPGLRRDRPDRLGDGHRQPPASTSSRASAATRRCGASAALIADPADYVLAAAAGGLLLLGYVAAFVAAGALLVARRDVT